MPHFTQDTPVQDDHADIDARLDTPAQPLIRPEDRAVFFSVSRGLRLTRVPGYRIDEAQQKGKKARLGLHYEFEGGYFRVTDKTHQRDKRYFSELPEDELEYTDTALAEDWIRSHDLFGHLIHEITAQEAPIPEPVMELQQVANAAAEGDLDRLTELFKAERDGYGRQVVLDACAGAAERIEGRTG